MSFRNKLANEAEKPEKGVKNPDNVVYGYPL